MSVIAIAAIPERAMKMDSHPLFETFSFRNIRPRMADQTGCVATMTSDEATEVIFKEAFHVQKCKARKQEVVNTGIAMCLKSEILVL